MADHRSIKRAALWLFVVSMVVALTFSMLQSRAQALAPAWQPNTAYAVGALVSYNGTDYKCLQAHTSQVGWEPPNVPALWSPQASSATATASKTATTGTQPTATGTTRVVTATKAPTSTTKTATPTRTKTNVPPTTSTPSGTFQVDGYEIEQTCEGTALYIDMSATANDSTAQFRWDYQNDGVYDSAYQSNPASRPVYFGQGQTITARVQARNSAGLLSSDPVVMTAVNCAASAPPTATATTNPPPTATRTPTMPPGGYPAWDGNSHQYFVGDRVSYAGSNYEAKIAHTSTVGTTPNLIPVIWRLL